MEPDEVVMASVGPGWQFLPLAQGTRDIGTMGFQVPLWRAIAVYWVASLCYAAALVALNS